MAKTIDQWSIIKPLHTRSVAWGTELRKPGDRARLLLTEAQAHAVMLSDSDVQMLQHYEAHLERVLYRALHELEAMKEQEVWKAGTSGSSRGT